MSLSLATAKTSMSHSYKVVSVTDQSENYKVTNIESKNPTTCWRTSKVCEQASVDIKFSPIKLHHIDIITQFSPQIEITAYNKNEFGENIDEYQVLPRVTIFTYKEVLEGHMHAKTKKYDFYDKPFIPNITWTHMRITVSNPQHQEKAMCLGLNSFILFSRTGDSVTKASPGISFLEQKHREVDEQLRRAVGFDRLQPSLSPSPSKINLAAEKGRKLDLFKKRDHVATDSRDLYINNMSSSNSQRRHTMGGNNIGLNTIVPGLKRNWDKNNQENIYDSINGTEKKIRPNYTNRDEGYNRSNLGRPVGPRRTNDDGFGSGDDELQRAIRESEKSFKMEKERWDQYENEDRGTSKKVTGLTKIKETDERTQDLDDFQRAIRESKELYLQEADGPKLGLISSIDSQDETDGKAYIKMLERVAEEEEDEIGEIPEDDREESEAEEQEEEEEFEMAMDEFFVKEKEEKEDDAETEVLEDSMAKLWRSEDDEKEIKKEDGGDMEIEERKGGEGNSKIKLTFDLGSQGSVSRKSHQLWGRPDTNNMISFVEKDFYNKYLHMETKARNDAERRKGGINRVEVVTSYENILSDVVFCLAGCEGDEKKSLKDLGISMGARFLDDIYANLTTHVITTDTITKKYKRAKKMKNVVVVSTRWLIECYGQKKRLSEKDFVADLEDEFN